MQLLCTGIAGEYLAKTYLETKHRPIYIAIKTIQQYEQGRKDINKAQAEYVIKLAQVLCCNPVDLLEIRK